MIASRRSELAFLLLMSGFGLLSPSAMKGSTITADQLWADDDGVSDQSLSDDDRRSRFHIGRTFRRFVHFVERNARKVPVVVPPVVQCISDGVDSRCVQNVLTAVADDVDFEADFDTMVGPGLGASSARVTYGGVIRFINDSTTAGGLDVMISPGSMYDFELSALPGPEPNSVGRSFVQATFGVAGMAPLLSFNREVVGGALVDAIPEASFTLNIAPLSELDVTFNIEAGANTQVIPEPASVALLGSGLLAVVLALRCRRVHLERSQGSH